MKKPATTDNRSKRTDGDGSAGKGERQPTGDDAGKGERQPTERSSGPIRHDEEVQQNNDEHIDQDFPGYPHHPSHGRTIHNGSAGSFDATEHSHDEEDEDQDSDDFAMDH